MGSEEGIKNGDKKIVTSPQSSLIITKIYGVTEMPILTYKQLKTNESQKWGHEKNAKSGHV